MVKNMKRGFLLVLVLLTVFALCGCNTQRTEENPATEPPVEFQFYLPEIVELPDSEDVDVMILDCDDDSDYIHKSNVWVTHSSGEYVQGTGALAMGNIMGFQAYVNFEKVDISSCKEGSIHLSVYMDKEEFENAQFVVELNSSGAIDIDEICWFIPTRELNVGWNDLYLNISDSKKTGEMIFEEVQYIRLYTQNSAPGQKFIVDNIYACENEVEDDKKIQLPIAAANKGYLVSFDSMKGIHSNCKLYPMTSQDDYKEGSGAVLLNVEDNRGMWIQANLNPVDLSAYQEGLVSAWVYINDLTGLNGENLFVELSSSGTFDKEELSWQIPNGSLHTGWNKLQMPIASAYKTGTIDITRVNYLRIHVASVNRGLIMMFDGVQAGNIAPVVPKNGMILDCDSIDNLTVKQTVNQFAVVSNRKEGTGAFSNTGTASDRIAVIRHIPVDISAYKNGGLHLWLYVENVNVLTQNVAIEIGSAGSPDQYELQWWYPKTQLKNGWNEIELFFSDAIKTMPNINLGSIKWFRVFCNASQAVNFKFDDVRAVMNPKTQEIPTTLPAMLWDADSPAGLVLYDRNTYSFTSEEGYFKQGTAAYRNEGGATNERLVGKFQPAVDISNFPDAALHLWLYVDDAANVGERVMIELGSGNAGDVDEFQWNVYATGLKNGWNELILNFCDATQTGTADLSKINWFRIFTSNTSNMVVMVDEVSIVEASETEPEDPTQPEQPPASSVVLWNCDNQYEPGVAVYNRNTITITTEPGEVKEGTAAYKNVGSTSDERIVLKFNPVKDVSMVENGALHLWLSIDDVSKLTSDVRIELGSGNAGDVDEYQWNVPAGTLQTGWNELILKFSDAIQTGTVDQKNLNWFRMFTSNGVDLTVIVDDISVVKAPETEPEEPTQPEGPTEPDQPTEPEQPPVSSVVLWNCDNQYESGVAVYNRNTITITTEPDEVKEGTAAYKNVGSTNDERIVLKFNPVKDASMVENGALHLWLSIDDVSKLTGDVRIELGSGNAGDVDEYQWNVPVGTLQTGWNELVLPFVSGITTGSPNAAALNWFRMFTSAGVDLTVIVDDISVVEAPETEPEDPTQPEQPPVSSVVLWNCDNQYEPGVAVYNRNTITITTEPSEVKEGTAAYKNVGSTNDERIVLKFNPAKDASTVENGALHLWLSIDDVSKLTSDVRIELGSGNAGDVDEYQWNVSVGTLQTGWNELTLKFSDAIQTGTVDRKNLNWFRMFTSNGVDLTVIVDDISVVETVSSEPEQPEENSVLLWNCDSKKDMVVYKKNTITYTAEPGEFKEGTAAYKNVGTGEDRLLALISKKVDISAVGENGALHLWLYVDDVNKLTTAVSIEISSSNTADTDEYQWDVSADQLSNGWNELVLSFADATQTGTVDLTKIYRLHIYTSANVNLTMIVDDVSAVGKNEGGLL